MLHQALHCRQRPIVISRYHTPTVTRRACCGYNSMVKGVETLSLLKSFSQQNHPNSWSIVKNKVSTVHGAIVCPFIPKCLLPRQHISARYRALCCGDDRARSSLPLSGQLSGTCPVAPVLTSHVFLPGVGHGRYRDPLLRRPGGHRTLIGCAITLIAICRGARGAFAGTREARVAICACAICTRSHDWHVRQYSNARPSFASPSRCIRQEPRGSPHGHSLYLALALCAPSVARFSTQ
jgi:hypothetical protein